MFLHPISSHVLVAAICVFLWHRHPVVLSQEPATLDDINILQGQIIEIDKKLNELIDVVNALVAVDQGFDTQIKTFEKDIADIKKQLEASGTGGSGGGKYVNATLNRLSQAGEVWKNNFRIIKRIFRKLKVKVNY